MKTIKITTREIFDNAVASCMDIAWDCKHWLGQRELMDIVVSKDIDRLRKAFKNGYTPMMMGKLFKQIDNVTHPVKAGDPLTRQTQFEIRIYDEDNTLLGVIIDSEIKF